MPEDDNRKISNSRLINSFDCAVRGLIYAIRTQRNMRIHVAVAIAVLAASLFLNLKRLELIAVIFAIAIVLITETLNTAAEMIVNLITEKHHPLAKMIKDISAGAVLFSAICAAVVGYLVFMQQEVLMVFEKSLVINKITRFPPYAAAVVVFLVLVVSLFIKALNRKGLAIEGGMPSIHTAVAFSLAVAAYFLASSVYVLFITLFMASMVGQSRVVSRIHSLWEVIAGAVLGTAVTVMIFQLVL